MDPKKICEAEENGIAKMNSELKEFYEQELSVLFNHSLDGVPIALLQKIAEQLHWTLSGNDWQELVYKMGLIENHDIRNVELYSKLEKELPIAYALKGPLLHSTSYGHIIHCLLEEQRFDVLKDIKPFTERLIHKNSFPVIQEQRNTLTSNMFFSKQCSNTLSSICMKDPPKETFKQEMSLEKNLDVTLKNKTTLVVKLPKVLSCLPSIKAFIPHTTADKETAQNVLMTLHTEGIMGKLLSDLDHLFAMNRTRALNAVLSEVDFIIPIISEAYLRQICPSICGVQDVEMANNCYIFNQLCSEHLWNGYMNYRVRPILVPEFDRDLLNPHAFLRDSALRFCEVQKLIRILKCTKPLIHQIKQ